MGHTVFYSWQADAPPKVCRNFIENALVKAIKRLAADLSIDESVRDGLKLDKDTRGVPGTPPIVDTIFRKIDAAAAFLADLTFVGERLDGRPTPNPNVLLEYGWALKSRGYPAIICVMNTAYGEPSDQTLPFNMKHLKWPIQYRLPETADTAKRAEVHAALVSDLEAALRAIVQSPEFRASIPAPPEPPKFEAQPPLDGPARFRARDAPLGVVELSLSRITGETGKDVLLAEGPALWLRVMPDLKPGRSWSIAQLRELASRAGLIIYPPGFAGSWAYVRGADGFGYVPHPPESLTHVSAVSFAFKSGEIWSAYAGPLGAPNQDTFVNIEAHVTECFLRYVRFMRDGLKIDLPYRWIAGIEGIRGKRMQHFAAPGMWYPSPYTAQCTEDMVSDTGLLKQGDVVPLALKPFFEKLYDACGEERGAYMDKPLLALQD